MRRAMTGTPFGPEDMARRRKRALALALLLPALAVMFFFTPNVRPGGALGERAC